MFKPSAVFSFLSWPVSIAAILRIIEIIQGCKYFDYIQYFVDMYSEVLSKVFIYIEPIIKKISQIVFDYDLVLYEHWRHFLVFLLIYYASEIRTERSRIPPRPINRKVCIVLGPILAVSTAVLLGLVPLQADKLNWAVFLAAPFGFVIFAVSATLLTTTFYRPSHQNWQASFVYNLKSTMLPYLAIYAVSAIVAAIIGIFNEPLLSSVVSVPVFIVLASFWWIYRGYRLASNDRGRDENWINRFFRAGSTKLAFNILILITISGAISVVSATDPACLFN